MMPREPVIGFHTPSKLSCSTWSVEYSDSLDSPYADFVSTLFSRSSYLKLIGNGSLVRIVVTMHF